MASVKQPQILQLTPASEIIFEGPFDVVVTSYLELNNPSDKRVCFKVKTTAPRRYCVRPNSGVVEPGSKVKIAIMLQPIEQESQSERSKHKFMVQSLVIKDGSLKPDEIWQSASSDATMDSKLRCVFHLPGSSTTTSEAATSTTPGTLNTSAVGQSSSTTNISSTPATLQQQTAQALSSQQMQHIAGDSEQQRNVSRSKETEPITSSPLASPQRTSPSSSSADWTSSSGKNLKSTLRKISDVHDANRSSQNLTSSFLQPMSDDYKRAIIGLIMLIAGVILGKYIL